jgi:hypothetical protein
MRELCRLSSQSTDHAKCLWQGGFQGKGTEEVWIWPPSATYKSVIELPIL